MYKSNWIVYEIDSAWGSTIIEKVVGIHSTLDEAIEDIKTQSWERSRPVTDYRIVELPLV
jgi:hypothetical protein